MHYLPYHTVAVSCTSNNVDYLPCVEDHYAGVVSFVGVSLAKIDSGLQKA